MRLHRARRDERSLADKARDFAQDLHAEAKAKTKTDAQMWRRRIMWKGVHDAYEICGDAYEDIGDFWIAGHGSEHCRSLARHINQELELSKRLNAKLPRLHIIGQRILNQEDEWEDYHGEVIHILEDIGYRHEPTYELQRIVDYRLGMKRYGDVLRRLGVKV